MSSAGKKLINETINVNVCDGNGQDNKGNLLYASKFLLALFFNDHKLYKVINFYFTLNC